MKQKLINFLELTGLTWFVPIVRLCSGDDTREQLEDLFRQITLPLTALLIFFFAWSYFSPRIKTSVGQLPGPSFVLSQADAMWQTHKSEKINKEEFEKTEIIRQSFAKIVASDQDNKKKASDLKNLSDEYAANVANYSTLIADNKKIVNDAEAIKLSQIKAIQGDKILSGSVDGGAKSTLTESEEAAIANIKNTRVAVYAGNVARIYQSSQGSLNSVLKSAEKLESYYTKEAVILASAPTDQEKQLASNQKKIKAFEKRISKPKEYISNGSIIDYIKLSITTVLFGFFLAAFIAIPMGILCGLSPSIMTALNPLIQTFRPVSPLAWVLITIQIIDGIFVGDQALTGEVLKNTFLHAGITVALCSLWATLSNTALGVSSVDPDHMNVAKVLKLSWFDRVFKIVIPSAIPYIFTGLRITLGVGWMVLIVAEMMATSRGLGWFIDQEYQNNKVESLANIIVCIFIIGIIGAILDRIMSIFQKLVSFNDEAAA